MVAVVRRRGRKRSLRSGEEVHRLLLQGDPLKRAHLGGPRAPFSPPPVQNGGYTPRTYHPRGRFGPVLSRQSIGVAPTAHRPEQQKWQSHVLARRAKGPHGTGFLLSPPRRAGQYRVRDTHRRRAPSMGGGGKGGSPF